MTTEVELAPPPPVAVETPPPPPPAPEPLAPVAASERVEIIDIIRGLALFGILAANIRGFAGPAVTYLMPHLYWPAFHDRLAQAFITTFVQGKFITIFAFLFGVGFAMQLDRASARGGRFGWTYARRLGILVLFGLIHGLLIWFGDILLVYALIGFLLLFFRKRRDKTLAIWAAIGLLFFPLLSTAAFIAFQAGIEPPAFPLPTADELAKLTATFSSGSWIAIQKQRMSDAVAQNWGFMWLYGIQILGLFLLGMIAWRRRFLQPAPESLPRYRTAMWWGLGIGITGNVAASIVRWFDEPSPMPSTPLAYGATLAQLLGTPALSLGYVCLAIVLCHDPAWRARLQRFGAVGRTALTNYLLQSILGTLIFYSYGLRQFGKAGPALLLIPTVVIFALQVMLSVWWLERYRFGPVEWLWRRLTYGGPLPLARETPVAASDQSAATPF